MKNNLERLVPGEKEIYNDLTTGSFEEARAKGYNLARQEILKALDGKVIVVGDIDKEILISMVRGHVNYIVNHEKLSQKIAEEAVQNILTYLKGLTSGAGGEGKKNGK